MELLNSLLRNCGTHLKVCSVLFRAMWLLALSLSFPNLDPLRLNDVFRSLKGSEPLAIAF